MIRRCCATVTRFNTTSHSRLTPLLLACAMALICAAGGQATEAPALALAVSEVTASTEVVAKLTALLDRYRTSGRSTPVRR